MTSVQDAFDKIKANIKRLPSTQIKVEDALGFVTTSDILSPINMPPFNQSAMDGYAICGNHLNQFKLIGEIQAGESGEGIELAEGEAVRIFTGALVPTSATAIAKQEIVESDESIIQLTERVSDNMNIRFAGEQVQTGAVVLKKDTTINLGAIGYLYMLGIHKVEVSRKPKAIIIVTGNELMAPGQELISGKIYESNSYTLKAALKSVGVDSEIQSVKDDFESTKHMISKALSQCDLVITSGGISVGDYDFVGKAMNELGVNEIFYKLKQKPGKPLFFGTKDETSVFALPGNPAAVLSCFYMYVIPAIRMMQGYSAPQLEQRSLKITSEYKKGAALTHFLKAYANGNEVRILNAQSSAMLSSFSEANCLAKLPEGRTDWSVGDNVEVFMLP